jgi:hypothetical protein
MQIAQRLTLRPSRVVVPRLGWLPAGVDGSAWSDLYICEETTVGQWNVSLVRPPFMIAVDLGAHPLDTDADPIARTVQVRGRDGYVTRSGALAVHLADGRWLRVYEAGKDNLSLPAETATAGTQTPPLSFDTARALAEGLRLAPPVDPSVF